MKFIIGECKLEACSQLFLVKGILDYILTWKSANYHILFLISLYFRSDSVCKCSMKVKSRITFSGSVLEIKNHTTSRQISLTLLVSSDVLMREDTLPFLKSVPIFVR